MKLTQKHLRTGLVAMGIGALSVMAARYDFLDASSHREAPMIANDPLADNTDVYAFRSPDNPNTVTLIANYVPLISSDAGPQYHFFGENIRYEVHVKNKTTTTGDDITYRFTFKRVDEDPTTFFRIRLGKENNKNTYTCERSTNGGKSFTTIVSNGKVPPPNIGPRSIEGGAGLNTNYSALVNAAITTASTGEKIFCGPVDDPFFVDLGGIFDLGGVRPENAVDGLKGKNVLTIALQVPIQNLQKDGKNVSMAKTILDPDFVIGVWASASRPKMKVLNGDGTETLSGDYVQVSRLGMPLTNEVIIPQGQKDYWNALTPYQEGDKFDKYLMNPELALYMDDSKFGGAVPGLAKLRIQTQSLQNPWDFRNGKDGLYYSVINNRATPGTAFDPKLFQSYLVRQDNPRATDLLPIFMTGVPNLRPYQLAVKKLGGEYLSPGKPFIHNFLPTFGDMLRLNMAVPPTPRNDANFSSLGLVQAAVLGLTTAPYNMSQKLEFIPNMDGFPNGRRLEDDVTRIELQAVGGIVLAAIGLWYDDYQKGSANPVTQDLLDVYTFTTGVEANDVPFKTSFPYQAEPPSGVSLEGEASRTTNGGAMAGSASRAELPAAASLNLSAPEAFITSFPNPAIDRTTFKYRIASDAKVTLKVFDKNGTLVATPVNNVLKSAGVYEVNLPLGKFRNGTYYVTLDNDGVVLQNLKLMIEK
jgi:hypothetical protein